MNQTNEAAQGAAEREQFEKTMNAMRFFPRELDFSMTKSPSGKRDEYVNTHLQSCWEGWQARAALKAQPAPTEALPKLSLALPDYERRALLVLSDEMVGDERIVCISIQEAATDIGSPLGICCYGGPPKTKKSCGSCAAWQEIQSPTEATQGDGTFINEGTKMAAQGEDSARVDAIQQLRQLAEYVEDDGSWKYAEAMRQAIDVLAALQPQEKL